MQIYLKEILSSFLKTPIPYTVTYVTAALMLMLLSIFFISITSNRYLSCKLKKLCKKLQKIFDICKFSNKKV